MKKILVIEDDQVIRENLLKLLKAEGFDVTGAENGAQGLNAAVFVSHPSGFSQSAAPELLCRVANCINDCLDPIQEYCVVFAHL